MFKALHAKISRSLLAGCKKQYRKSMIQVALVTFETCCRSLASSLLQFETKYQKKQDVEKQHFLDLPHVLFTRRQTPPSRGGTPTEGAYYKIYEELSERTKSPESEPGRTFGGRAEPTKRPTRWLFISDARGECVRYKERVYLSGDLTKGPYTEVPVEPVSGFLQPLSKCSPVRTSTACGGWVAWSGSKGSPRTGPTGWSRPK